MKEYKFTVRKRKDAWQLVMSYKDSQGRWRQITKYPFAKKSLALSKDAKDSLLARIPPANLADVSIADMTLAEFLEEFKKDRADSLTYNTIHSYDIALARVPALTRKTMVKITYADVLHAMRSLGGLKASSVNLTIQKLKALFTYATDVYHLFPINPIAKLPYKKKKEDKRVKALTEAELSDLLSNMETEGSIYYTMCCIAGYAGLRFGEICGLTSDDVDVFNQVIHVRRQWGLVEKDVYNFKAPKSSNGFRDVPIPPRLATVLSAYMDDQQVLDFTRRLFPLNASSYINRRIKKYYPACSVHQLRHTYGTMLLSNGVDVKTVAALMGDNVETILNTYIHYTDDMRTRAKNDVSRIFG